MSDHHDGRAAPSIPRSDALATYGRQDDGRRRWPVTSPTVFVRGAHPAPTVVFDTYWRFATRRQDIFFGRLRGESPPWTDDAILARHRFTNSYRVLDRVSQYLIREVLRDGVKAPEEVFFRTMVFKLFNRIDTWELLRARLGPLAWTTYRFDAYDAVLSDAMHRGERIYSAAYIMPSATSFGEGRKHRNHLRLIELMMRERLPQRLAEADTMAAAFGMLRSFPSIGDFLAYQLVTDLNYTGLCSFSEMEFVVPGPGARDGMAKCFESLGDLSPTDTIRWVADSQAEQFASRGLAFADLWGRPLQLIDCQNLFCEVDKYARLAHPEVPSPSGRSRIKQRFRPAGPLPPPVLPTAWGIDPVAAERGRQVTAVAASGR